MQETEVKLYTPDLEAMQRRLEAAGARLVNPRTYERNVRYDNPKQDLKKQGMVLRLREDNHVRLTFKNPGSENAGIVSRGEIEVEVSDFAKMELILASLGYFATMVYEKYRTTYHLMNTEVVLDEMPYGNFMEIEGKTEDIERVVDELRLGSFRRYTASYTRLFENVAAHLNLGFEDLTFNNFEGITVPESAFL